jgi:hypothetical protein
VVTLTFEPRGDQTLVQLRHTNIPDDELGRRHEQGWGFVLGAIGSPSARQSRNDETTRDAEIGLVHDSGGTLQSSTARVTFARAAL